MPNYNPMGYLPYANNQFGVQPNFYQTQPQQPNYMQQNQYQQPSKNLKVYDHVNGVEGAKAYQIQPNTMMMLMDSEYYVAYRKTSNSYGQSNVEYFQLVPMTEQQAREFMNPNYKASTPPQIDTNKFVSKEDFEHLQNQFNSLAQKLENMAINKKSSTQTKGSE